MSRKIASRDAKYIPLKILPYLFMKIPTMSGLLQLIFYCHHTWIVLLNKRVFYAWMKTTAPLEVAVKRRFESTTQHIVLALKYSDNFCNMSLTASLINDWDKEKI